MRILIMRLLLFITLIIIIIIISEVTSIDWLLVRLVRLGSFPACWRQAKVAPIPKGPPSSSVANYRPISITYVLSKLFERLVSVRLGRFM